MEKKRILCMVSILLLLTAIAAAEGERPRLISQPDADVMAGLQLAPETDFWMNLDRDAFPEEAIYEYRWGAIPGAEKYVLAMLFLYDPSSVATLSTAEYTGYEEKVAAYLAACDGENGRNTALWIETAGTSLDFDCYREMVEEAKRRIPALETEGMGYYPPACFLFYDIPDEAIGAVTVTSADRAFIRRADSEDAPLAGYGRPGETFACVGTMASGWHRILLESGETGYVSPNMVRFDPFPAVAPEYPPAEAVTFADADLTLAPAQPATNVPSVLHLAPENSLSSTLYLTDRPELDIFTWPQLPGAGKYYVAIYDFYAPELEDLNAALNPKKHQTYEEKAALTLKVCNAEDSRGAVVWFATTDTTVLADYENTIVPAIKRQIKPPLDIRPGADWLHQLGFFLFYSGDDAIGTVTVTSASRVSIRDAGDAGAAHVRYGNPGEAFVCLGTADSGWYAVMLEEGKTGYISPGVAELVADP